MAPVIIPVAIAGHFLSGLIVERFLYIRSGGWHIIECSGDEAFFRVLSVAGGYVSMSILIVTIIFPPFFRVLHKVLVAVPSDLLARAYSRTNDN